MEQKYLYNKCGEISLILGKIVIVLFLVNVLVLSAVSCFKKEVIPIIEETYSQKENKEIEYSTVLPKKIDKTINLKPPIVRFIPSEKDTKIIRNIVKDSANLIKRFEGFSKRSYRCPGNKISIGYGFERKLFKRNKISHREAEKYLCKLIVDLDKYLDKKVKVGLTHGQKIALISFVYNIGKPKFEKSTMLKYINSYKFDKASKEFNKWVYCSTKKGKKKLKGLTKRRELEKKIFLSDIEDILDKRKFLI